MIKEFFEKILKEDKKPKFTAFEIFKYIGPGLLVTIGFIDPGNWASNVAAGSGYGYQLLWMVTLSTIMLIFLQHNSAHIGIVTGLCLSEAATKYLPKKLSRFILSTGILAVIATSMAEILGGAIALEMLFSIPLKIGAILVTIIVVGMLLKNTYFKLEKWIIAFLAIIGLSFIYELTLVDISWHQAINGWIKPSFPSGSIMIIMSVLGAVVMPHNLFLHSEIIQSRQWNLQDEKLIKHQLKFEFIDTLVSMLIGWAINSSMILLAASAFFSNNISVNELGQAKKMLEPLLGNWAAIVFAVALLFAGLASTITAVISGGSIFAGMFNEPYDIDDKHSRIGVGSIIILSILIIFFISDPFKGLVISQMLLSIQLPITIFTQIYLTSSEKVMGKYKNTTLGNIILWTIGAIVSALNVYLFIDILF